MFTTLAVSSFFLAAAPAVFAQSTGSGSCTDVHIFIARGWNEDYPGRQGNLTTRVCNNLPGKSCDYEDIAYDAYSTDYCPSVDAGEALALSQINAYYAKCPDTAIVLSGYSEGATVMGNVLAGDGGDVYCPSSGHPGITDTTSGVSCNIAAVTLFGNPRHTANQPYNVLDGVAGQANSHRDAAGLARMATYTPRLHDYCNYDDLICAQGLGADTVEAHTNYFELYSEEAAEYIAGLVKGYSKDKYCAVPTTSSASSSASATASSSSASVTTISSKSGNMTVPYTTLSVTPASSVSSTASVPYITVTDVTSVYTTICPQTSTYTTGNMTKTSTWTGPSLVTSTQELTTTTTVPATYVAPPSSVETTSMTTISGKPAVVDYTTTVSTTTYLNFPTLTITLAVPTATYWANGMGNSNGTKVTGFVASGSAGLGGARPTGTGAPISPYTGGASAREVAARGIAAIAVGVVGVMML